MFELWTGRSNLGHTILRIRILWVRHAGSGSLGSELPDPDPLGPSCRNGSFGSELPDPDTLGPRCRIHIHAEKQLLFLL